MTVEKTPKKKTGDLKPLDNHATGGGEATPQDNHATGGELTTQDNHATGDETD
ncbi:sigma-like protein [Streptomyces sp. WAC 00631]|uniref:sigma-like protein n=1 Tax=unclassified Streptomyces TaxID=2593676 RepID=UPI000F795F1D|nr:MULTISPECIES: sigma-like protein [unclassified Streptomyces]MCC5032848.1 sigma-like protein [Streptomyces sp. WAC 00631]MCC9740931.1 sigma-like protein [Streptomyces sp. MNU89]